VFSGEPVEPVSLEHLVDAPSGSVARNAIYHWNPLSGSFEPAEDIVSGHGYWMAVTEPCALTLDYAG